MAQLEQRFEIDGGAEEVFHALCEPGVYRDLPGVHAFVAQSAGRYVVRGSFAGVPEQFEIEVTIRPMSLEWRSGDGRYHGATTVEAAGEGRSAVLIVATDTQRDADAPPGSPSTAHTMVQHFKHNLEAAVRRTRQPPYTSRDAYQARSSYGSGNASMPLFGALLSWARPQRWLRFQPGGRWSYSPGAYSAAILNRVGDQAQQAATTAWNMAVTTGRQLGVLPPGWSPEVECVDRGNEFVVYADLPGVAPEHVQVEIRQGGLVIEGDRRDALYTLAGDYRRTERRYGRFFRTVPLPSGLDTGKATASMQDGVLQITFARSGGGGAHSIPVVRKSGA